MIIDDSVWVYRGGSWGNDPRFARPACRFGLCPSDRYGDLGFRISRLVNPLQQLSEVCDEYQ